ncbi:Anoctamin-9 [Manis javanica]|nr:Anoctamin-9 [Manis javanica]
MQEYCPHFSPPASLCPTRPCSIDVHPSGPLQARVCSSRSWCPPLQALVSAYPFRDLLGGLHLLRSPRLGVSRDSPCPCPGGLEPDGHMPPGGDRGPGGSVFFGIRAFDSSGLRLYHTLPTSLEGPGPYGGSQPGPSPSWPPPGLRVLGGAGATPENPVVEPQDSWTTETEGGGDGSDESWIFQSGRPEALVKTWVQWRSMVHKQPIDAISHGVPGDLKRQRACVVLHWDL